MEEEYFAQAASDWDTPYRINRAKIITEAIRKELRPSDQKALEFGCGTGLITAGLVSSIPHLSCTDASVEMIEALRSKDLPVDIIPTENLGEDCYFGRFDLVYSSMVFHHIRRVEDEILKLRRLIIKGGRFMIVDLDPVDPAFHAHEKDFSGHHGFERDRIIRHLNRCGFTDIQVKDCFSDTQIKNGKEIPYSLFLAVGTK